MWTKDALDYYGGASAVADAIGISPSAVSQWGEVIPFYSATQLHLATMGQISLEPEHYGNGGRILPAEEHSSA